MIGLGDLNARFRVYVQNRPPLPQYQQLWQLQALQAGEIDQIYRDCGNGWRKLFNVYAKLLFELGPAFGFAQQAPSWQQYRDQWLLQQGSGTALLFSPPDLTATDCVHLIAGRSCAKAWIEQKQLHSQLHWLNQEFAIDPANRLLVTPYFDYRQLSNEKITKAAGLVRQLASRT
ncbi:hypothetical protein [Rheinheimera sp.]|uniref:DUF6942 family protein n=1 Tax=Rheinheimera sp. TaxID=1869214 RepID=UPI00307CDB0E